MQVIFKNLNYSIFLGNPRIALKKLLTTSKQAVLLTILEVCPLQWLNRVNNGISVMLGHLYKGWIVFTPVPRTTILSESCFVHKNSYLSCLKTTGSVAAYKIDALAPPKKSEIFFAHPRADFVQFSAKIKFLSFFNLNFGLRD